MATHADVPGTRPSEHDRRLERRATAPRFFDPERILQVLHAHEIGYVLVGGLAATLHGSPAVTYDVDIVAALARRLHRRAAMYPVAGGYDQLVGRTVPIQVGGVRVLVAALADIISSKEAAGRPKDLAQLPALYALRNEVDRPRQ